MGNARDAGEGRVTMSRVLVVDDDPAIREMLEDVLTEEGYDVVTARDGVEALEVLERGGDYLVLLDLMMPRLDGRGVIRSLEQRPEVRRASRVVVMSAADRLFAFSATLQSNIVVEQIAKPFELDILFDVVGRLAPPAA
jgi:CheY-like chemotaxis protein